MPQFLSPIPKEEIAKLTRRSRVDLSSYKEYLSSFPEGQVGRIQLEETEKKATVVNHLKRAAEETEKTLKLHRSPANTVMFEIVAPEEAPKPRRRNRS